MFLGADKQQHTLLQWSWIFFSHYSQSIFCLAHIIPLGQNKPSYACGYPLSQCVDGNICLCLCVCV